MKERRERKRLRKEGKNKRTKGRERRQSKNLRREGKGFWKSYEFGKERGEDK